MTKLIASIISIFGLFFMIEYEGYDWNPCSPGGSCLAIYCGPSGMCHTDGEVRIYTNKKDVMELFNKRGAFHLKGIYRVEWPDNDPLKIVITKLKLVPSFELTE